MDESGRDDEGRGSTVLARRDALKRAAIAGGAIVWAAPLVQAVGTRGAFAVSAPPQPPDPPKPPATTTTKKPRCREIDYCCLVFKKHSKKYKAKWDRSFVSASGNPSGCGAPSGWSSADKYKYTWAIDVDKEYLEGKLYKVTFELPYGYSFYNGGCARAKDDSGSSCLVGSIHSNGRKCTFTAPIV